MHGKPRALRAAEDAAVVAVAQPVDALGIGHRQRFQHQGVDQREDPGIRADSQRQRDRRRGRESLGGQELPQGKPDIVEHTE